MTEDQYQQLISITKDNSGKLNRIAEHLHRIDGCLEEHDAHFLRIEGKLQEHDARFDGQDAVLDLVVQKVGEVDMRLDGFINLMKASPLWRLVKVAEG